MSSNDNSGDQLVASIRKTKAAGEQAEKTAAATKPRRRTAAAKPKPAAAQEERRSQDSAKRPAEETAPSFSFGRRVWPD